MKFSSFLRPPRIFLVLAVALAGLVLGLIPAGLIYNTLAERSIREEYPAPALFITVNGVRVHYLCDGDGDPTVVLLHAAPGSLLDATLMMPFLAERVQVCAFDTPGNGWSEPLPDPAGLDAQARHLRATLATLNIRRPVLVGHSMGGALALTAAAQAPGEVRALVLLDPTTPYIADSVRQELSGLAQLRLLLPLGISHLAEGTAAAALLRQQPPGGDLSRPLAEQIAAINARTAVVDTLARNAGPLSDDLAALEGRLPDIAQPTLILAPSQQSPAARGALERLQQTLPKAELAVIEESGHYVQLAQPEAVARRVTAFAQEQ